MRHHRYIRTRRPALVVVVLAAAMALNSCAGSLNWIQDRLPPPHEVENGIEFRYHAPSARQVTLAGGFNNWGGTQGGGRYDSSIDPMEDIDGDGVWTIVVALPPGRYQYKYVIDGGVRWEQDPNNPDKDFEDGIENSLIVVPPTVGYDYDVITGTVIGEGTGFGGGTTDASETTDAPVDADAPEAADAGPVEFAVDFPDASSVSLAGTFNDWDPDSYPLTRGDDGLWHVTIELAPGSYVYKFVVDGTWVADPGNPETVDDGYGGVNSSLTVE